MADRDTQIVIAALTRAAMVEELRSEAARSQATKEPSGSESKPRMMARARQSLQGAAKIRALADDPAEVAAILATVPEVGTVPNLKLGSGVIYGGTHTKVVALFGQPTAVLENTAGERVTVSQDVLVWHTVTPPPGG